MSNSPQSFFTTSASSDSSQDNASGKEIMNDENTTTDTADTTASSAVAVEEKAAETPAADATPAHAAAESATSAPEATTDETPAAEASTEQAAPADTPEQAAAQETPAADAKPAVAAAPDAAKPAAVPSPAAIKPAAPSPTAVKPAAVPEVSTEELAARGREHGRATEEGVVFVKEGDTEREIGSYPGAREDEALAYFVRKYDEMLGQLDLAEQRLELPEPPLKEVSKALKIMEPAVVAGNVLGDVMKLRSRFAALETALTDKRKEMELRRAEAKKTATVERTEIVAKAEALAKEATDTPQRIHWRNSAQTMKDLFEQWRTHQKSLRLDKPVEDELWERFRLARNSFDKLRREHFADMTKKHDEVKAKKRALIERAEKLSTSTEWGPTSGAYRELMNEWKAAGRAGRKDDNALWDEFRAAQDKFFNARNAASAEQDKEFSANLVKKEALLEEAEKLLPIKDVKAAKRAMRDIGERWEAAGKVPRADMSRVEGRLRKVEQAIREIEDAKWKRSNPERKARAEGLLGQLQDAVEKLEKKIEKAEAAGDKNKVKSLKADLEGKQALLTQMEKTAADFGA